MRGSCLGAHALSHEFVSNVQASWELHVATLNLEQNYVGSEGNLHADRTVMLERAA